METAVNDNTLLSTVNHWDLTISLISSVETYVSCTCQSKPTRLLKQMTEQPSQN